MRETFLATRGAFTSDFEVPITENPKPSYCITIPMASTTARYFHKVTNSLHPTHLAQFILTEDFDPTFSLYSIRHSLAKKTLFLATKRCGSKNRTIWVNIERELEKCGEEKSKGMLQITGLSGTLWRYPEREKTQTPRCSFLEIWPRNVEKLF